jgi:hypothetical protein
VQRIGRKGASCVNNGIAIAAVSFNTCALILSNVRARRMNVLGRRDRRLSTRSGHPTDLAATSEPGSIAVGRFARCCAPDLPATIIDKAAQFDEAHLLAQFSTLRNRAVVLKDQVPVDSQLISETVHRSRLRGHPWASLGDRVARFVVYLRCTIET